MAKIPLKEIVFPGLDNTYTIPEIDSTLSTAGKAADAKKTGDEIDGLKEDLNELNSNFADMQSDGAVPSAEQILTDKGVTDSVPYRYRKTGGDGADRLYDQIVGGTVNWNQLIHISQSSASKTENGITFIDNRDGSYTFSTVESGATQNTFLIIDQTLNAIKEDHVFVILGLNASSSFSRWYVGDFYNLILQPELGKANSIVKSTGNGRLDVRIKVSANAVITTPITINPQYIDLTAMFGSTIADYIYQLEQTTEGAGVAFFKSLFPNTYYPYNAGELVSVSGLSEHKMVGFNQWDEEIEEGFWNTSTGQAESSLTNYRNSNPIKVLPNTAYYTNKVLYRFFYDADMNFVQYDNSGAIAFTTPSEAHYMNIRQAKSSWDGTNTCINLSDPAKNGTYEPYKAHSYPLDSDLTLRGIPKLVDGKMCFDGDTYDADGTVTRKRRRIVVDGNTYKAISVNLSNGVYYIVLNAFTSDVKAVGSDTITKRIITNAGYNDYPAVGIGNTYIIGNGLTCVICLFDQTLTDVTSVNNYLASHPIVMEYELATPTTEGATPYQHLQQCDPNGTEEYVSTGIVPVGHNSFYPENLRAKVEQLPWNFANLIAPTESAFVATRNYVTGDLFIVSNVLYKATSNIANGGTITPNTNCTATTLAEIISALA